MKWLFRPMAFLAGGTLCMAATAGEGSFGWLYTLDLQPKGTMEFEQKLDLTTGQQSGNYNLLGSRSGIEYGVTTNFQLTGYLNAYSVNASKNYLNCDGPAPCTAGFGVPEDAAGRHSYSRTQIDGVSIEAIWRLTNPVTSPVGVGLYLEPTFGQFGNSVEARVLLQSNFLDDRLVTAINLVAEVEKITYTGGDPIQESQFDILYGVTYNFAPQWTAGFEGRFHNDFQGYRFDTHTQQANFIGPNLHYATKDWWVTAAWRYQLGGTCWEPGEADCSGGMVSDSHGRNQFIVKFGFPLS